MITISIDGKTYKTREDKRDSIMNSIGIMDSLGYLEEVKENKEPQPQEDIELLNEFHHETCSDWKMGLQVELLTNRLNQLIKANKKPL